MNDNNTKRTGDKLKTLREILKTHATQPRGTRKRSYIRENSDDDGAISSEFAYISRFAGSYENQKVVEQIKNDILAMTK
jgi:hypothetical protein